MQNEIATIIDTRMQQKEFTLYLMCWYGSKIKCLTNLKKTFQACNLCILDVAAIFFMNPITHYRVLPWATGQLTLLKSTTKVPEWQVAKTSKFFISDFLLFLSTRIPQYWLELLLIWKRKSIILHSPIIIFKESVIRR